MDFSMEFGESPRLERIKLSTSQFGLMVDFITLNPEMIGAKFSEKCDKGEVQRKWEELAVLLNSDETGARKSWERWRKSWSDMKIKIKHKIAKINSKSPYMVKLNDIESKAWKLMSAVKKNKDTLKFGQSNLKKNNAKNRKLLIGKKYNAENTDNEFEANLNEISSMNNVSEENGQARLKIETESNISGDSRSNISEKNLDESNAVSDNLVTISDAWNLSMESEPESVNVTLPYFQDEKVSENCESNGNRKFAPLKQNSSHYYYRKRLTKFNYKPLKVRRQDPSITSLLQRQNELLETIAESIMRIETAVVHNSSQQVKKNDLKTVHNNIGKIAECFGSVSASLKKIVEK